MVHDHPTTEYRGPITPSSNSEFTLTGPVPASSTRKTTPNGLEIERERLLDQGCYLRVVATLQQARKKSTNSTCSEFFPKFCYISTTTVLGPTFSYSVTNSRIFTTRPGKRSKFQYPKGSNICLISHDSNQIGLQSPHNSISKSMFENKTT